MRSIQTKIIVLILTGIIVSTTIIGGIGILSFVQAIDDDSVKVMNLMCSEKAEELNNIFGKIQQSVEIMAVYAVDNLESIDRLSEDSEYLDRFTKELDELGRTIANETQGAVATYVRFSPDITSSKAGFFRVKNVKTGGFENKELTDLSQYSPDDMGYVGWYYLPVKEESPVWIQPYYNQNIGVYMISYVIPMYKDDVLLGVVGMDIDFNYITEKSDSIQIYDTGHAFLLDKDFKIVHSRHFQKGTLIKDLSKNLADAETDEITSMDTLNEYTMNGEEKRVAFRTLENGMCLAVTAPVSEIDSTKNQLILQIIVSSCFIITAFILIAWAMAKTIVKPLKELNIAAKKIADGNLDISISCKSRDEVGTLAENLSETAYQLKVRIDYINHLAYIDKLTGINNNTAYLHEVSFVNECMKNGEDNFAVFVIDVNGLKSINDTYGHDYGNELIIAVAKLAADVFGNECVYRIGGDEFAVIMRNIDTGKSSELEMEFAMGLKTYNGEIKLSAAIGSAVYDGNIDNSYESVFRRADGEMYQRKKQMKNRGQTSTVKIKKISLE